MKCSISLVVWLVGISVWTSAAMSAEIHKPRPPLHITVVYNNIPHTLGLTTA